MPPPSKTLPGNDFVDALNASVQSPLQGGEGKDLPDGFPMPQVAGHRVIDASKEEGIDGASAYDYTPYHRVFLIYRPWGACNRCANQLANGAVSLPDDEGDITCPHTQLKELNEIRAKGLSGQLLLGSAQESVLRDGSIIVSMQWYEAKINYKRQRALKKKLEREVATQTSEDADEPLDT